jgi:hypothetical protein
LTIVDVSITILNYLLIKFEKNYFLFFSASLVSMCISAFESELHLICCSCFMHVPYHIHNRWTTTILFFINLKIVMCHSLWVDSSHPTFWKTWNYHSLVMSKGLGKLQGPSNFVPSSIRRTRTHIDTPYCINDSKREINLTDNLPMWGGILLYFTWKNKLMLLQSISSGA